MGRMNSAHPTPSAATTAVSQKGTAKLCSNDAERCGPERASLARVSWIVSTIWMPATSPICAASNWAALMTPYSDSASSLDMVAEVAGMETPMPRPESANASRIRPKADDVVSVAKMIMEISRDPVPKSVAVRSPVRTVM